MRGRFGRTVNTLSIAHQSAGVFRCDIGITSPCASQEMCTLAQHGCLASGHGDSLEIDQKTLDDVVWHGG